MIMGIPEKWSFLMKKVLKVIVPILLALLIIASVVWYCFVYDQNFTRDMMLKQARLFSENGNQLISSWFYDLAYKFCAQDDDVAIELADQYKNEGNYTKAEYTLSKAIADGGGADLYVALSKTYVEQDKLMDAVAMLDNITNPEIKAQLDALRPAAPASDPAAGYYSQYVTITLNSTDGTMYYTLDGEYPSIDGIPYSEPITLPGGETIIYAVNVADNGLVSPLSIMGFTITGVVEPVSFEDAAIEQAVRELLELNEDETVYTDQLWNITSFTVPNGAETLTDLTKMAYLETLVIHDYEIDSLAFLSPLVSLTELDLTGCSFPAGDLSIIGALTKLQSLILADCSLSTVSGLETAVNLTYLDLENNTIRKLDALSSLVNLTELDLQHNAVTTLSSLAALPALEKLNVSYNSLTEFSPLASCGKLTWLDASNNKLTTIDGIGQLSGLTYLSVSSNELSDISALSKNTGLTELYIASNSVKNISDLSALTNLEVFDFAYNEVTKLPEWPTDCALRIIDGSYNQLSSLSNLKGMENLTHVYMDYNQITSVSPMKNCFNLMYISVYGSAVTGVESLTEQSIIVNYDPTATEPTEEA